jgi:protein SCO1/2
MVEDTASGSSQFLASLPNRSSNLPAFQSARPALLYMSLVALLLGAMLLSGCQSYEFKGTLYADPQPAPDFELTAPNGEHFRLSDHQGEIVLMFFGYTSCPDVCPTTLAEARRILEGLGEDVDNVTFLFITVDPERDTPEVLGTYATAFHPAIVGLTGSADDLAAVRQDYGIVAEKEILEGSAAGYAVTHTARVFLVDAEGRLRLTYSFGTPPEDILEDINHLLG